MTSVHRIIHRVQAAGLIIVLAGMPLAAMSDTIKIGGTGSALGTMKQLAAAFQKEHPGHEINVLPSLGSTGGIKALRAGVIDISLSSRAPKPGELDEDFTTLAYATTTVIFVSHHTAPKLPLDKALIADIYAGRKPNWSNGRPMRLVLRPQQDYDTTVLQNMSPAIASALAQAVARKGMVVAITDTEAAEQVENFADSFGMLSLAQFLSEGRKVNVLPVDGVMPSVQSLVDGRYPYAKTLYAMTAKKATPGTRQFMDFLSSSTGRKILDKTGHVVGARRQ